MGERYNPYARGSRPGLDVETMGEIKISVAYAHFSKESYSKTRGGNPMFPHSGKVEINSVRKNEIVFTSSEFIGEEIVNAKPSCLTFLNGLGSEAYEKFPDDEEQQRRELMRKLKVVGIAGTDLLDPVSTTTSFFSVLLRGLRNIIVHRDSHYGDMIVAMPMLPSEYRSHKRKTIEGTPLEKSVLIAEPFRPESVSESFISNMNLFLGNEKQFSKLTDPRYRDDRIVSALQADTQLSLMNGFIFLKKLMDLDIVQLNDNVDQRKRLDKGENATDTHKLLGMAQLMGLFGRQAYNIPGVDVSAPKKEVFSRIAKEILQAQHWNGTSANFGFTWDGNSLKGTTERGEIIVTTPQGRMLSQQMNLWKVNKSATAQWVVGEEQNILGVCVRASRAGYKAVIL